MPTQKDLVKASIKGANIALDTAERLIQQTSAAKGGSTALAFPGTAFYLPLINALLNKEIKQVSQLEEIIAVARSFVKEGEGLDNALEAGTAALLCAEIIEAIKYLQGPYEDGWQGFIPDTVYRSLGLVLVDGRMPAVGLILGSAPDPKIATDIIRQLQSRNILSLLAGGSKGHTFKSQLDEAKVALGLESYVVPIGSETTSLIHALNFVSRVVLSFGGVKKGDVCGILNYIKMRIPAFVIALGELDALKVSFLSAIIKLGLPVITDQEIFEITKCPYTINEALITEKDYSNIVAKAIEARGIKIKVAKIDIPVNYSAAFEGERIRKEQMYVEFGGGKSSSFEFVRSQNIKDIKDGQVNLVGPEISQMDEGKAYPLGIIVDVAGKRMEADFEPVLERQIHHFLNYAMGVFHLGQRDMNWIRISKDAQKAGLRIADFGKIIHAKLHDEYGSIVDRARVTLITTQEEIDKVMPQIKEVYAKRDERISKLTDESVDKFYSCSLCTSFAPNHICVISPERMGLCGAISWLDAKTAFEISPSGGNKPINKEQCLDNVKGVFREVNDFVYSNSNKTIERLSLYSLMESPMSACGCFECVAAVMPEANGIIIVNREYTEMTPIGMKFTTLAGTVGGGKQTPGFMGIAKRYIYSKKFVAAEGGLKRVVWMPKGLKEALLKQLKERAEELGSPGLIDKIADETICTEVEGLLEHLQKVNHPALSLEAIL